MCHLLCINIYICGGIAVIYFEGSNSNILEFLFVIFQISSNAYAEAIYILYCTRKTELTQSFNSIQEIVSARYNHFSAKIYDRSEWKVEVLLKWGFISMFVPICGCFLLATLCLLIFSFIKGEMNVHTWPHIATYKSVQSRERLGRIKLIVLLFLNTDRRSANTALRTGALIFSMYFFRSASVSAIWSCIYPVYQFSSVSTSILKPFA